MGTEMETQTAEYPRAIALVQPSVRMVVLLSWAWHDKDSGQVETESEVLPVLFIAAVARDVFRTKTFGNERDPATPAQAGRGGWIRASCSGDVNYETVVFDREYGVCGLSELQFIGTSSEVYEVVVCPWPPEDDESRLAPAKERVAKESADRFRRMEVRASAGTEAAGVR